ncbi:hypothetical protein AVEN_178426-1 [Araneus ventricosus]|uniref:DUF1758 domain-containing protein n=1 Tax=Araneus ventricosus TaxID=182803 RepID=A0A4Y2BDF4_ARAVE|nr:hypothetical protein AVEN_178426-1 [Araneus ventricosus]
MQVLLSSAVVNVRTRYGDSVACKAMLDSSSQRSIIMEPCWKKLGLKGRSTVHRIGGINNMAAEISLREVRLEFSIHFDWEIFKVGALIVTWITSNLPDFTVNLEAWSHVEGLKRADLSFQISSSVEILIGADLYADLIIGQSIKGGKGLILGLGGFFQVWCMRIQILEFRS